MIQLHVFRSSRFRYNQATGTIRFLTKITMGESEDISKDVRFVAIEEGQVKVYQPGSVFYNKVQEFNRDLSVLIIDTYIKHELWKSAKRSHKMDGRDVKILDALSATGLRAVRYAKEIESDKKILVYGNDILPTATEVIKKNAHLNGVGDKVIATNEDAALFMYKKRKLEDRFRVVDIDPYGSPVPFIDAAVQCVDDGGLLLVTCTDMAILCGNHPETCFAKYGSVSLKFPPCHEQALRIVLRTIQCHANKYGRYILPLLSLSIDFYIRLIVQVFSAPLHAKDSASKTGNIFLCQGCQSFSIQKLASVKKESEGKKVSDGKKGSDGRKEYSVGNGPVVSETCDHCGWRHLFGGPIWTDAIHSIDFIDKVKENLKDERFRTSRRIRGMLQIAREELPDVPLYHHLDSMAKVLRCPLPSMPIVRSAILNAGYQVSYSHASKGSIKTDAPTSFLWNMFRKWIQINPLKKETPETSGKEVKMDGSSRKEVESSEKEVESSGKEVKVAGSCGKEAQVADSSGKEVKVGESPGKVILSKPISEEISFEIRSDQEPQSKKSNMLRYQENPERNWGPKAKPPPSKSSEPDKKSASNSNMAKIVKKMKIDV